mmetsp:Transcript_66828/g.145758  ORF Transcript_66828/g.145758 Transcript_66828/m.145758 type:complete len:92 (+) Transcript_66828:125-400(+)
MAARAPLERLRRALERPTKQTVNRISWGVALLVAGKWIYDSEQTDPWVFSEAPTVLGTPQARILEESDVQKWNANIQPKAEQLVWKPDKAR